VIARPIFSQVVINHPYKRSIQFDLDLDLDFKFVFKFRVFDEALVISSSLASTSSCTKQRQPLWIKYGKKKTQLSLQSLSIRRYSDISYLLSQHHRRYYHGRTRSARLRTRRALCSFSLHRVATQMYCNKSDTTVRVCIILVRSLYLGQSLASFLNVKPRSCKFLGPSPDSLEHPTFDVYLLLTDLSVDTHRACLGWLPNVPGSHSKTPRSCRERSGGYEKWSGRSIGSHVHGEQQSVRKVKM